MQMSTASGSVPILPQRDFHHLLRRAIGEAPAERIILERTFRRAVVLEFDPEPAEYDSDSSTITVKPERIPCPKHCDLDNEIKRMGWSTRNFKTFKVGSNVKRCKVSSY